MPGNTSYAGHADMVKKGKNFTILGDSVVGGIKRNDMNKHSKRNVHLETSRGATCKDMLSYVQPTLDRAKSDGIIIHLGLYDDSILLIHLYQLVKSVKTQV